MTSSESIAGASRSGRIYRHSPLVLFAAGFISVVVFQQGCLAILNGLGLTPATPFPATRTWPLGVPQIWSFAFWGGVWGLIYGYFEKWFPDAFLPYCALAIVFGAVFPTLVLWFFVFPLKGIPVAAGFDPAKMATHVALHGAWGLGMGLMVRHKA